MRRALAALLAVATLAACAGPEARIRRHKDVFATCPPETQEAIKRGQVQVGMTPEMVQLAAGNPDTKLDSRTAAGTQQTWIWYSGAPSVGFGFGIGSWGPHTVSSVGVGVGGPAYVSERLRVVFEDGRVVSVNQVRTSS